MENTENKTVDNGCPKCGSSDFSQLGEGKTLCSSCNFVSSIDEDGQKVVTEEQYLTEV